MNKIKYLLYIFIILSTCSVCIAQEQKDYAVIYFYGYNCPACTRMDLFTFSSLRVKFKLKEYDVYKINGDVWAEQRKKYNVTAYPTIILTKYQKDRSKVTIIRQHTGYMSANNILKFLNISNKLDIMMINFLMNWKIK